MAAAAWDTRDNERAAAAVLAAAALPPAVVLGALALLIGPVAAVVVLVVVAVGVAAAVWLRSGPRAVAALGGVPADRRAHARLINLVEGLCVGAGVTPPHLVVIDDPALNAVAVGRDPRRATLAVTSGLLAGLSRIELEGVLAEELVRIKRRDTLPATLAAGAGPLARRLADRAPQEQTADLAAVALTRYPPGLASALEKLAAARTALGRPAPALGPLWLADPRDGPSPVPGAGHQPLAERVAALREL